MKFGYKKFNHFYRPVIPIKVKHNSFSVGYEVLIDSGADLCIFDAEIGEILGIDIKSGQSGEVSGVAGQISTIFVHTITIEVGGHSKIIDVGFLPRVAGSHNYGVVGQYGFFDQFLVAFDYTKKEIELTVR